MLWSNTITHSFLCLLAVNEELAIDFCESLNSIQIGMQSSHMVPFTDFWAVFVIYVALQCFHNTCLSHHKKSFEYKFGLMLPLDIVCPMQQNCVKRKEKLWAHSSQMHLSIVKYVFRTDDWPIHMIFYNILNCVSFPCISSTHSFASSFVCHFIISKIRFILINVFFNPIMFYHQQTFFL